MTITYGNVRATLSDIPREERAAPLRLCLSPNDVLGLAGQRRGLRFHCLAGKIWLTQAGDPVDHFLAPGDTFTTRQRGRLVLQALSEAMISVS